MPRLSVRDERERNGTRIRTHLRRRHSLSKYLETSYSVEGSTSLIATSIPRYDPRIQESERNSRGVLRVSPLYTFPKEPEPSFDQPPLISYFV
jgi:hypothetical protein